MKTLTAVKSSERTLRLLEELRHHPPGLTLSQIAQALNIPASSTFGLLQTLEQSGYLQRDPATRRYRVGVKLFELGRAYVAGLDLVRHGAPVVHELAQACGETVALFVREARDVISLAQEDSRHAVRIVTAVGRRLPAHCCAAGKVLLAAMDGHAVRTLYAGSPLERVTEQTIVELPHLEHALAVIRPQGFACDDRESDPDIKGLAMPVSDHTGCVVAAVSIMVPALRMPEERYPELLRLVGDGTAHLSRQLGYPLTIP